MSGIVFVELEDCLATSEDIELSPINRIVQTEILYYNNLGEDLIILSTNPNHAIVRKWLDNFQIPYDRLEQCDQSIPIERRTMWKQAVIIDGSIKTDTIRVYSADPETLYQLRKYDTSWALKLVSDNMITPY